MSWLQQQKIALDKEIAKVEAETKQRQKEWEARFEEASNALKAFVNTHLNDLKGKKTKDGREITLNLEGGTFHMYADKELMLYLHFSMMEENSYDGDGYSWGTGHYYIKKKVRYCLKYKDTTGYHESGGLESPLRDLYESDLAHYLLTFIDI